MPLLEGVPIDMSCGCSVVARCCICGGRGADCFPFHFARARWRVYPALGSGTQGAGCTDRAHRRFFEHGGADYGCPVPGCRGGQLVLMIRPTQAERTMLYQLARRLKPRVKAQLRRDIREGKEIPELFAYRDEFDGYDNYMDVMGTPDIAERHRPRRAL